MADTFNQTIDVLSLHRVIVSGTVDDPGNVASVKIFRGKTDVGSADVSANGNWHLAIAPSKNNRAEILSAVVTDGAGTTTNVSADFSVIANPAVAVGDLFQLADSDVPVFNVFSSDGTFIINASESVGANSQLILSETGHGANVPFFCFTMSQASAPSPLVDEITNFHVAKASHDFLDLSNGPFSSIAQVLRHTSTVQGSATIHLDQDSTVTVDGVTKAQLAQHHNVFFFG